MGTPAKLYRFDRIAGFGRKIAATDNGRCYSPLFL
jgi:hypothetical protein